MSLQGLLKQPSPLQSLSFIFSGLGRSISLSHCSRSALGSTCRRQPAMRLALVLLLLCWGALGSSHKHENPHHPEVSFLAQKSLASEECASRHKNSADLLLTAARIRVRDGDRGNHLGFERSCWHILPAAAAGGCCRLPLPSNAPTRLDAEPPPHTCSPHNFPAMHAWYHLHKSALPATSMHAACAAAAGARERQAPDGRLCGARVPRPAGRHLGPAWAHAAGGAG